MASITDQDFMTDVNQAAKMHRDKYKEVCAKKHSQLSAMDFDRQKADDAMFHMKQKEEARIKAAYKLNQKRQKKAQAVIDRKDNINFIKKAFLYLVTIAAFLCVLYQIKILF